MLHTKQGGIMVTNNIIEGYLDHYVGALDISRNLNLESHMEDTIPATVYNFIQAHSLILENMLLWDALFQTTGVAWFKTI